MSRRDPSSRSGAAARWLCHPARSKRGTREVGPPLVTRRAVPVTLVVDQLAVRREGQVRAAEEHSRVVDDVLVHGGYRQAGEHEPHPQGRLGRRLAAIVQPRQRREPLPAMTAIGMPVGEVGDRGERGERIPMPKGAIPGGDEGLEAEDPGEVAPGAFRSRDRHAPQHGELLVSDDEVVPDDTPAARRSVAVRVAHVEPRVGHGRQRQAPETSRREVREEPVVGQPREVGGDEVGRRPAGLRPDAVERPLEVAAAHPSGRGAEFESDADPEVRAELTRERRGLRHPEILRSLGALRRGPSDPVGSFSSSPVGRRAGELKCRNVSPCRALGRQIVTLREAFPSA
jgi:hypothetical protein